MARTSPWPTTCIAPFQVPPQQTLVAWGPLLPPHRQAARTTQSSSQSPRQEEVARVLAIGLLPSPYPRRLAVARQIIVGKGGCQLRFDVSRIWPTTSPRGVPDRRICGRGAEQTSKVCEPLSKCPPHHGLRFPLVAEATWRHNQAGSGSWVSSEHPSPPGHRRIEWAAGIVAHSIPCEV